MQKHQREAEIVAEAGKTSSVTIASNMAGRGTDIKLSEDVRKAGGLAIIGTERHESRRVDRQLRGRAGRQGDPGSSQFYVSLEDDLMRLFGSDRIARMMDRLGIKEGEVIQHSMITKSIERAQKKVEENNFGIRKRLLEYDDVMNVQREVIYRRRRNALFGEITSVDIAETFKNVCNAIVFDNYGEDNYEAYSLDVIKYLGIQNPVTNEEYVQLSEENQAEILYKHTIEHYHQKCQQMIQLALPIITDVYKTSGQVYQNIIVPISDGLKTYQVITHLKKAVESEGKEIIRAFEKTAILATIDEAWKEHLREMDELKQSVQNAVYEQKDPLLIYKFEATELFKTMQDLANREIVALLTKGFIPMQDPNEVKEAKAPQKTDLSKLKTGREDVASPGSNINPEERKAEPVRVEKKIGRNDPCPCGSGKKYKHCHGKNVTVD
jgi:preprotein translocase subunit SecA